MSSYLAKNNELEKEWFVVDAADKVLGRMAAKIALVLMGKHKPTYTPNVDTGDFVIVLNAGKVRVTGRKAETRIYDTYSRYPGGRNVYEYERMIEHHPEKVIELAVRRMLPKNKLARHMLTKLKVYGTDVHPHSAQNPSPMKFDELGAKPVAA